MDYKTAHPIKIKNPIETQTDRQTDFQSSKYSNHVKVRQLPVLTFSSVHYITISIIRGKITNVNINLSEVYQPWLNEHQTIPYSPTLLLADFPILLISAPVEMSRLPTFYHIAIKPFITPTFWFGKRSAISMIPSLTYASKSLVKRKQVPDIKQASDLLKKI